MATETTATRARTRPVRQRRDHPRAASGGSAPSGERAPPHHESRLGLLAERGARADLDARENLKVTYKRFMDETEPARKDEAAKDLVRAILGKDVIAEDTVL